MTKAERQGCIQQVSRHERSRPPRIRVDESVERAVGALPIRVWHCAFGAPRQPAEPLKPSLPPAPPRSATSRL